MKSKIQPVILRSSNYIFMGLNVHINNNSREQGEPAMITLGIIILAFMGTSLLVLLDTLVYHISFSSSLYQLYSLPTNSSVGWFLGAALFTAGWTDLKNTTLMKRLATRLSIKRG